MPTPTTSEPPPAAPPDTARIARLEAELAVMSRELTERVAVRTEELRKANERLYQEIIDHRKSGQVLRVTEQKYRGFFEHAVEGAYQSTPEGTYLSINPSLAKLYGYATTTEMQAAVANIAVDIYVDPTMRQRFKEIIERDGEVRNLEYQVRRHDGAHIWISENARVARSRRGTVLYYEGTIQDITRRKEAEAEAARLGEQLLQAQKMEAIGTLAGGVAHDFNNILSAILGNAELGLDDVPANSPAALHLHEVIKAARRAREHVRQILAFSRRHAPDRQAVRVGPIIREAVSLVRATIPSTIRIEQEIVAPHDHAMANPAQLHQILVNLCANASHAMHGREGVLLVRLENVALGGAGLAPFGRLRPGVHLQLSVRDSGHGIPPDVLPRIFDPFFTTKPVGEGTGLGLSVVHGIVQNHGGEIQVESAPGVGSTFAIWLPVSDAVAPAATAPAGWCHGQGQRILVVDDEEGLVRVLEEGLARLGYVPRGHVCSRTALAEFQAAPANFDLVITDHTMPNLNGADLAQALHAVRADIPIILCSGYADVIEKKQARAAGIRRLLFKPMDLAQLSQAIHETLQAPGQGSSAPWPE